MTDIDLSQARSCLEQALDLINSLHGTDLDETNAWADRGKAREEKLAKSRALQVAAHRCDLASQLVMNEYWIARGVDDALEGP